MWATGVKALMYQAVPEGTPQDVPTPASPAGRRTTAPIPATRRSSPGHPRPAAELRRRGCKLGVLSNKFDGGVQFITEQVSPRRCGCAAWGRRPAELPRASPTPRACSPPLKSWEARRRARCNIGDSRATRGPQCRLLCGRCGLGLSRPGRFRRRRLGARPARERSRADSRSCPGSLASVSQRAHLILPLGLSSPCGRA